jgi:hypothetical protein
MVRIDVRQNLEFISGYPYNSKIDSYFQNLSEDFIKNYGLDEATVMSINDHKNSTQRLDSELHTTLYDLSKFIIDFDTYGLPILQQYNELIINKNSLVSNKEKIILKRKLSMDDNEFISHNLSILTDDIQKITDFIRYYQSQVVENNYFYNDNYVIDTTQEINTLHDIMVKVTDDFVHYEKNIQDHVVELSKIKTELLPHTFFSVTLRMLYEEWEKRTEVFYQDLVEEFKDEYETYWTYGSSIMFGKKTLEETSSTQVYDLLVDKWYETLTKKYNFSIELAVKEYSLLWLQSHKTFNNNEFLFKMTSKKVDELKKYIAEVDQLIIDKKKVLLLVVTSDDEKKYFKYREITLEKLKYLYTNLHLGKIDQHIVDAFDTMLDELQQTYDIVAKKYATETYWEKVAEFEIYSKLGVELNRQLNVAINEIDKNFINANVDNSAVLAKINFYTNEKNDLDKKYNELMTLKEAHEIDNKVLEIELNKLTASIIDLDDTITAYILRYKDYFDNRLPFFKKYIPDASTDMGYVNLLRGNFVGTLNTHFQEFVDYECDVEWYSVDDRNKLLSYYKSLLTMLQTHLVKEWDREFTDKIFDISRLEMYNRYLLIETKLLYGMIHSHILNKQYSETLILDIDNKLTNVKDIFKTVVTIAFDINQDISVVSDLFDYTITHKFTISSGQENFDDVITTFNNILSNIVAFTHNKNMEFKRNAEFIKKQEKIDMVWLDMEKKYV